MNKVYRLLTSVVVTAIASFIIYNTYQQNIVGSLLVFLAGICFLYVRHWNGQDEDDNGSDNEFQTF